MLKNESSERQYIQSTNYGGLFLSPVNQGHFSSWMHGKEKKNVKHCPRFFLYYIEQQLGNGVHFVKFVQSQLQISYLPNVVKIV